MRITIDTTEPLSNLDARILAMLVGSAGLPDEVPEAKPEPEPEPEAKPAKKAAAKKQAKKPEPEPEPEPMAEEPVEEEEPEAEEEIGADEQSDEDLLALAVKKATEMVAGGEAAKVREALDAAGASRVRELNADNVREFFKALT